jgi:hypothetical protein
LRCQKGFVAGNAKRMKSTRAKSAPRGAENATPARARKSSSDAEINAAVLVLDEGIPRKRRSMSSLGSELSFVINDGSAARISGAPRIVTPATDGVARLTVPSPDFRHPMVLLTCYRSAFWPSVPDFRQGRYQWWMS